jgi:hypothetical protein
LRERVFDDWSLDGLDISIDLFKNLVSYGKFMLGGLLDFVHHFVFFLLRFVFLIFLPKCIIGSTPNFRGIGKVFKKWIKYNKKNIKLGGS